MKSLRDAADALLCVLPAAEGRVSEAMHDLSKQIDLWDKENGPQHEHDSECCTFLGRHGKVDIWWCEKKGNRVSMSLTSVLGRYGSDGPEYASSHPPQAFAEPIDYLYAAEGWYHQALSRAKKENLLTPKMWEEIDLMYKKAEKKYGVFPTEWDTLGERERVVEAMERMDKVR